MGCWRRRSPAIGGATSPPTIGQSAHGAERLSTIGRRGTGGKETGTGMFVNIGARELLPASERRNSSRAMAGDPRDHLRLGWTPEELLGAVSRTKLRAPARRARTMACMKPAACAGPSADHPRSTASTCGRGGPYPRAHRPQWPARAGAERHARLTQYQGDLTVLGAIPGRKRDALMRDVFFIGRVAVLPRWMRSRRRSTMSPACNPRFDRAKAEPSSPRPPSGARARCENCPRAW